MTSRRRVGDALARLERNESAFVSSTFLAPAVPGRGVTVKITGVRCEIAIAPADFAGWGVFRAESFTRATLIREASPAMRRDYLRLFPATHMIVCAVERNMVLAVADNARAETVELRPVRLCDRVNRFDPIVARFDGATLWFDAVDPRADPAAAPYLRQSLLAMTAPNKLDRAALCGGHRVAYAMEYSRRDEARRAGERNRRENRLVAALAHAGASLSDFAPVGGDWQVTFTVDGRRHASIVRGDDFTVRSAGICLSGEDEKFDLASLVSVLRESATP